MTVKKCDKVDHQLDALNECCDRVRKIADARRNRDVITMKRSKVHPALSKTVCQYCVNRHGESWDAVDDWRWKQEGRVRCPYGALHRQYSWRFPDAEGTLFGGPPPDCPYILEQVAALQMEKMPLWRKVARWVRRKLHPG